MLRRPAMRVDARRRDCWVDCWVPEASDPAPARTDSQSLTPSSLASVLAIRSHSVALEEVLNIDPAYPEQRSVLSPGSGASRGSQLQDPTILSHGQF
jgi:hypothetical protein